MGDVVYNYTKHSLPTGAKDALSKIRAFLVSQGWTSEDYRTGVKWLSDGDGTYSWHTGEDNDYCQMATTGYNPGQVFRIRLYMEYSSTETSHYRFYAIPIDPTAGATPDDTTSTAPYDQDTFNGITAVEWGSVPSGTFNELYLFGNSRFCQIVFRVTSTTVLQMNFGFPELYPEYRSSAEFQMRHPMQNDGGYLWSDPDNGNNIGRFYHPWAIRTSIANIHFMWLDGASVGPADVRYNISSEGSSLVEFWNDMDYIRKINSFTGKRIMVQPDLFILNSSGMWEPAGHHPTYCCPVTGLAIGETLTYGTEEYMTFPTTIYGEARGYAIRVA